MKLERIEIRGFKTFSSVTLPVSSLSPGLHFIVGKNLSEPELESNGSGKSSLFGAMFWALFGKTVDGLRNTDVKPWKLKEKTSVTVHLDGTTVSRSVSPNRTTLGDKDAGPEQIEKLLGIGYDLASHTILMGQGRPLFFDLPPARKMELLSEALKLERWESRSRLAGERANELEEGVSDLERQVHSQVSLEGELYQLMRAAQDKAKEWDEREQVDLENVEKEIAGRKTKLEPLQKAYAKHDLAYDGAQTELRALATQIRDLNQEDNRALAAHDKAERLRAELAVLDIAGICPTCGQTVTKKNLETHRAKLVQQLETIPVVDVVALGRQLDTLTDAEDKLQEKSNRALDAKTRAHEGISQLNAEIAVLKKSLTKREQEINPFQEQIAELKTRRAGILKDLERLEKEISAVKKELEQVKFWVKGFKEVRLFILEEILQDMELVTNSTLEEVGLIGWSVHYEVEKETKSGTTHRGLNVWVQSPTNNEPVRWESWSGGESQRLKIIGAAALNDVLLAHAGAKCNVEIWDESSSFMSDGGVEDFIEFLANRAEDQQKVIFMVDHMARESARFMSTITVTKKDGVSTIS